MKFVKEFKEIFVKRHMSKYPWKNSNLNTWIIFLKEFIEFFEKNLSWKNPENTEGVSVDISKGSPKKVKKKNWKFSERTLKKVLDNSFGYVWSYFFYESLEVFVRNSKRHPWKITAIIPGETIWMNFSRNTRGSFLGNPWWNS